MQPFFIEQRIGFTILANSEQEAKDFVGGYVETVLSDYCNDAGVDEGNNNAPQVEYLANHVLGDPENNPVIWLIVADEAGEQGICRDCFRDDDEVLAAFIADDPAPNGCTCDRCEKHLCARQLTCPHAPAMETTAPVLDMQSSGLAE